jgi:hypothetical protein
LWVGSLAERMVMLGLNMVVSSAVFQNWGCAAVIHFFS